MGGLITRVALLGSAQGWEGFPPKLDVNNVVTLSTPHRASPTTARRPPVEPDAARLDVHRAPARGTQLDDAWAEGTDWSLVGSERTARSCYDSAIDKGDPADQKFGYLDNRRAR